MQHPFVLGSSWPLSLSLGLYPWRAEAHGGPFSYSSSHCCDKIDAQEEQVQPGRAHLVPSLRAHSWRRAEGSGCGSREWSGWSHLSAVWKQRNTNTCIHFLLSPLFFYSVHNPSPWLVLPHWGWVFPLQLYLSGSLLLGIFISYFLGNTKSYQTDNED